MPRVHAYPGNIDVLVTRATIAAYNYGLVMGLVQRGNVSDINGVAWRSMIDGMVDVLVQTPNANFDDDEVIGGLVKAQTILIVKRINEDSFGAQDVAERIRRAIDFIVFGDWSNAGGSNEIVGGPPGPGLRQKLLFMVSAYIDGILEYSMVTLYGSPGQLGVCAPGYVPDLTASDVVDGTIFGSP